MSRIKVDRITNRAGTGDPLFPNGISVVGLTSLSNVIAGVATFSNVSIGGTITYEDVTNQDVIGLSTFRAGVDISGGNLSLTTGNVNINADNAKLNIGASADISIYHDGNDSFISGDVTTTDLVLRSKKDLTLQAGNNAGGYRNVIYADNNGDVRLYNISANAEKFRTTSAGVKITGQQVSNVTAISGTAIDCSLGNYFTKTITGATAFTFTNTPASGIEYSMTVELDLNGNTGVSWPTEVTWPTDTAPTITDGKTQLFMFVTVDGGLKWRGGTLVDYTT
tara:strand:+ start:1130 stop:1969 length:840 start_codon:yes stop_codon:yes gene_type:complete